MFAALLAAAAAQACLTFPSQAGNRYVALEGALGLETHPGPPNYENVRTGDRAERIFVLTLARPICIDDGGDFADPVERVGRVQLFTTDDALRERMRASAGLRIRIRGQGFAAHNAHHRTPMVVEVSAMRLLGR